MRFACLDPRSHPAPGRRDRRDRPRRRAAVGERRRGEQVVPSRCATPHALFFKPSGVAPKVVRKAKVHFRHRGGKTRRHRVPTVNVRTALTSGSLLRVKKPKPARGGKLEIVVDDSPETVPPPVTTPPPTSGCELGSFSADKVPGSCWRPYGDSSPFNRRVPANPQIASGLRRDG